VNARKEVILRQGASIMDNTSVVIEQSVTCWQRQVSLPGSQPHNKTQSMRTTIQQNHSIVLQDITWFVVTHCGSKTMMKRIETA